jgi:hypothetical protein
MSRPVPSSVSPPCTPCSHLLCDWTGARERWSRCEEGPVVPHEMGDHRDRHHHYSYRRRRRRHSRRHAAQQLPQQQQRRRQLGQRQHDLQLCHPQWLTERRPTFIATYNEQHSRTIEHLSHTLPSLHLAAQPHRQDVLHNVDLSQTLVAGSQ